MKHHSAHLHGDEPITSKTQDLLGRAAFAARIARDVLNAPVRRGFVISVTGDWGSGKTSVLRLVEENIGQDAVGLWFSPWMFSSAEELVCGLFPAPPSQSGLSENRGVPSSSAVARRAAVSITPGSDLVRAQLPTRTARQKPLQARFFTRPRGPLKPSETPFPPESIT